MDVSSLTKGLILFWLSLRSRTNISNRKLRKLAQSGRHSMLDRRAEIINILNTLMETESYPYPYGICDTTASTSSVVRVSRRGWQTVSGEDVLNVCEYA